MTGFDGTPGGWALGRPPIGIGRSAPVLLLVLGLLAGPAVASSSGTTAAASGSHTSSSSRVPLVAPAHLLRGVPGERPTVQGVLTPVGHRILKDSAPPVTPSPAPRRTSSLVPPSFLPSATRPGSGGGRPAPVVAGSFTVTPNGSSQLLYGAGFQGVDDAQCGCDPPDVQDAAGPNEVVEMVNLYIQVWNDRGTYVGGETLNTFYSTSNQLSDPRVIYDNLSGRYFASVANINGGSIYFAVSDNSSAAGGWTFYKILSSGSGTLADQPMMGVNATLLGFGANIFSSSLSGAAEYWVVNKSQVLQGLPTTFAAFGPDTSGFSIHPARMLDPATPFYFVESLGGAPGTLELFRINGTPPAATTVTTTNLTVGDIASPPSAPTPSGGSIDTANYRMADAVAGHGRLYLTFGVQCSVGGANRSCFRVDGVNLTPAYSVQQDFDIGLPGAYLYYPALSLDPAGDLVLTFGLSSPTLNPGIAATTERASDPPGTISPFVLLHAGTAGRPSACGPCRFGDYFGAGTAPNGGTVWVSGEYLTASAVWQTWIAPVLSAPRTTVNLSGPRDVDAGRGVSFTLGITSAPCGPGWALYCTASVPVGGGVTWTQPCGALNGSVSFPDNFPTVGVASVGSGGNVSVFNDSACDPANRTEVFPISGFSVTVHPAPTASLSDSNGGSGDVGESVSFVAVAHSGAVPYSYAWTGLPSGCLGSNTSTIVCAPDRQGAATVRVSVSDAAGDSVGATSHYTVNPVPVFTLNASASVADVGMNLTLSGTASGGTGFYNLRWFGLPPGCVPETATSQRCLLTETGTFDVSLQGNDSGGISAFSPFVQVIVAPALGAQTSAVPSSLAAGHPTTFWIKAQGGVAPYTYGWSGAPANCPSSQGPNETCAFDAGSYRITVTVRDSVGGMLNRSWSLTVPGSAASPVTSDLWIAGALVGAVSVVLVVAVAWRARRPPPKQ